MIKTKTVENIINGYDDAGADKKIRIIGFLEAVLMYNSIIEPGENVMKQSKKKVPYQTWYLGVDFRKETYPEVILRLTNNFIHGFNN